MIGTMSVRVIVREAAVVDDPAKRSILDDRERARADRRRDPVPFVAAHALARELLGDLSGREPGAIGFVRRCTTCGSDAHGKPSLADDDPWGFSLSYTATHIVAAAAYGHVLGVDIETLDEADFADFDRATLNPRELPGVHGREGDDLLAARATVWARKEAILKATGHGLVVAAHEVVVSAPSEQAALVDWQAQTSAPSGVALADVALQTADHRAAVAVIDAGSIHLESG